MSEAVSSVKARSRGKHERTSTRGGVEREGDKYISRSVHTSDELGSQKGGDHLYVEVVKMFQKKKVRVSFFCCKGNIMQQRCGHPKGYLIQLQRNQPNLQWINCRELAFRQATPSIRLELYVLSSNTGCLHTLKTVTSLN